MQKHGPWKIKRSDEVYRDPYVTLRLDKVIRPDGLDGQHVVVQIKPGVCVIACDDSGNVYLTQEFHYAVGRSTVEGVSGGIEPGEPPLLCAQRELQEELGVVANEWKYLMTVDPFTSIMESPTRLYLATDLRATERSPEGTELIEPVVMPLVEAVEKVESGEITHAPTCVALLLVARLMARAE